MYAKEEVAGSTVTPASVRGGFNNPLKGHNEKRPHCAVINKVRICLIEQDRMLPDLEHVSSMGSIRIGSLSSRRHARFPGRPRRNGFASDIPVFDQQFLSLILSASTPDGIPLLRPLIAMLA